MEKKFDLTSVTTISASHFFHDLYSHFLAPALPLIMQNLGISYSQAGLLSIFHRLPALLNPVIGNFASKKPVALVLSFSIIVTAASMCFITAAPSYFVLSALILTMGLSACFFHIIGPVMVKKHAGNRIGLGMSFYMFGGEMSRGVGPLLILAALSLWGPKRVYFLLPLAIIMSLVIIFKFRDESFNKNNHAAETVSEEKFFKVLKTMKGFFFPILMLMIARASISSVLNAFLPAYLTSKGYSLWFSGISLSILQVAAAAGTILAGPISDRFGKNNTLLVISVLSPILMLLFLLTGSAFTIILIILTGFVSFASAPVILAYVQAVSGKNPTVCSSIYIMIDFLTISAALVFTGFAGDFLGLKNAFLLSGCVSFIGLPFVLYIRKKKFIYN
ncbi:MAG: MFS transporter [Spirochaetia bacterium]|jgi:FSR family fosmidomycin resistance protein-like MFS transporter|nr:MFS transporter [Spirochaetia bacterium]